MICLLKRIRGFTLIETLVAVSLLMVAIVAPMSLVAQSLTSAYYARDQVTAYNLAQEGIEAVRAVRDGNILENALTGSSRNLLDNIPIDEDFIIDATQSGASSLTPCGGVCPLLQVDSSGDLYGHGGAGWIDTRFRRVAYATYVGPAAVNGGQDEIRVTITVSWATPSGRIREFQMNSNMYRWVEDGVGI